MKPRHFLTLPALLVALLLPASAQAKSCPSTSSSSLMVHRVKCRTAARVITRAGRHLRRGQIHFAVWVGRRRWGCDFANVAGYGTLTCERGYGTPRRQYIIFVSS